MPDPSYTIHVTLLPNGRTPQKLFVSALLTPALDKSDTLPKPFWEWPTTSLPLLSEAAWQLNLQLDKSAPVTSMPMHRTSAPPRIQCWTALFAPELNVRQRVLAEDYQEAWLVSHPASALHDRHTTHRSYDLLHRYARYNRSPQHDTFLPDVRSSITQYSPHNIFLHPVFDPAAVNTSVTMAKLLAEADTALNYANSFADSFSKTSDLKLVANRLTHRFIQGKHTLEVEGNMRLTGIALFALLRHCAESLRSTGDAIDATPRNKALTSLTDDIQAQAVKCTTYDGFVVTTDTFDDVLAYVEFHLFAQRPPITHKSTTNAPAMEIPATDTPDFHQMLGLLHQYPAILRPLGLAFDFEVDLSAVPITTRALLAAPEPLLASFNGQSLSQALPGITFDPRYTTFTVADFLPKSIDDTHSSRCLDLSDDSFVIVTEDTDGSSHKLTQQSASRARGKEYTTSAPTGLRVLDGRDHGNGKMSGGASTSSTAVQSLPSMRTCGVALYHQDRVNTVQKSIARAVDTLGQVDNPFCAEDLTLGYRIDIQTIDDDGKPTSPWRSLHDRTSVYMFVTNDNKPLPVDWKPDSPAELATDEGFLSLAVTQTTLPATTNADEIQQM